MHSGRCTGGRVHSQVCTAMLVTEDTLCTSCVQKSCYPLEIDRKEDCASPCASFLSWKGLAPKLASDLCFRSALFFLKVRTNASPAISQGGAVLQYPLKTLPFLL